MRVAVLSDIHGNLVALDAILADLAHQGPVDHIVVAGDLVWAGPWPAEVVDRVRAISTAVVQGNTDAFFKHTPDNTPTGKDGDRFTAHWQWMQTQLGPERAAYLAGLPFSCRISPHSAHNGAGASHDLLVVHANPVDLDRPIEPGTPESALDTLLAGSGEWAVLAFGHIHIPSVRAWRGRLLVNVASVGLPMDGDPRAAYALLTWDGERWHVEHRRVFYNVPVVTRQMRTGGMPRGKHFAERLMAACYSPLEPIAAGRDR